MLLWTQFDIKRCAVSFPGVIVGVVAGPFACMAVRGQYRE